MIFDSTRVLLRCGIRCVSSIYKIDVIKRSTVFDENTHLYTHQHSCRANKGRLIMSGSSSGPALNRTACIAALWLCSAQVPVLALTPAYQPVDAVEALGDLSAEDLTFRSPKMREFMRQWFDVVALDEAPCAPADIKLAPINIVCEFRPDYQFGYVRLPAIMVGIVGKSVEDARIASVVSDRTLPFYQWTCRTSYLGAYICMPNSASRSEHDQMFSLWDNWLPRTEAQMLAWHQIDSEQRYIQSVFASGKTVPAEVMNLRSWKQWQDTATITIRIERLVLIGQACQVLNRDDGSTIIRNAHYELEGARFRLAEEYRVRAKDWLRALRIGATQSANLSDMTDDAACKQFSVPYGMLSKLMTWTDRPQEITPGVVAGPRLKF